MAEALGRYAKQQQYSLEIQNTAAEIRLEAERKAVQLLKEMNRQSSGRPARKNGSVAEPLPTAAPTLADLGISKKQSSRWQLEAAIPEADFQTYVAEVKANGKELTSAAVLRQALVYQPPSTPREKRWSIEYDVEAFFDLWDRLCPHWHTLEDKARIGGALRGLLLTIGQAPGQEKSRP